MLGAVHILTPLVEQHYHISHLLRDDPSPIFKANGLVVLFVTGIIGELDGVVLLRLLIKVMGIHPATVQLGKANLVRSQQMSGLAHYLGSLFNGSLRSTGRRGLQLGLPCGSSRIRLIL